MAPHTQTELNSMNEETYSVYKTKKPVSPYDEKIYTIAENAEIAAEKVKNSYQGKICEIKFITPQVSFV